MNSDLEIVETLPAMHPGEVLREEFMRPMNLTAYAVAKATRVPRTRIERIAREELGISGDTALRLGKVFGLDPHFWLNLQAEYELRTAAAGIPDLHRLETLRPAA